MRIQKKKEEKRKAILAAALGAFKGRRFDEVKLADIALLAGVGKGTLYLYFKNKEELFVAMACDGTTGIAARIREIADSSGSYRDRLFLFGREFSAFARERHGIMRMTEQASSPDLEAKVQPQHAEVKAAVFYLFQKGVEEGALRADVSIHILHCMLIGPLFFRVRMIERINHEVDLESMLQFFWKAAAVAVEDN